MSDSYIALVEKSIDERTQQYQELLQLRAEKENLQKELFNYEHHSKQRLIALREAESELREEKETAARLRAENEKLREALGYYAEEDYNGYNGSGACARAILEGETKCQQN